MLGGLGSQKCLCSREMGHGSPQSGRPFCRTSERLGCLGKVCGIGGFPERGRPILRKSTHARRLQTTPPNRPKPYTRRNLEKWPQPWILNPGFFQLTPQMSYSENSSS